MHDDITQDGNRLGSWLTMQLIAWAASISHHHSNNG